MTTARCLVSRPISLPVTTSSLRSGGISSPASYQRERKVPGEAYALVSNASLIGPLRRRPDPSEGLYPTLHKAAETGAVVLSPRGRRARRLADSATPGLQS